MKFRTVCLALLTISLRLCYAQMDTLWDHHFGGTQEDICQSLVQLPDGGFALLGETMSYGAGGRDMYLVRTNAQGNEIWHHTYGYTADQFGMAVQKTLTGGFVLAGYTTTAVGNWNAWVVNTSSSGDTLWTRQMGSVSRDEAHAVIATADGGFVVAGYTLSSGQGSGDFWLFKLNAQGDSLWRHTYGGTQSDNCWSMAQTADGGFLLAGQTQSFGSNHSAFPNFWIVRTNSNGDSLWSRAYGGTSGEVCSSVAVMPDGGFVLGGYTSSFGAGLQDAWIVRTNSNGDSLWSHTFGTTQVDLCSSVLAGDSGSCWFAGSKGNTANFWLVKLDSLGNQRWEGTLGGTSADQCNAFVRCADQAFALAGSSFSYTNGNADAWLVKTYGGVPAINTSPNSLDFGSVAVGESRADSFLIQNPGEERLRIFGVDISPPFRVSFSGEFRIDPGAEAWMPVTFTPDTALTFNSLLCVSNSAGHGDSCISLHGVGLPNEAHDGFLPSAFAFSAFPNPFNAVTTLSFDLPQPGHVTLALYDIVGERADVLTDGVYSSGHHSLSFDGSNLPSGIYFAQLVTSSHSLVQKLVLLK